MKIPQRPPRSPVQEKILDAIRKESKTITEIAKVLGSPRNSISRAIKRLIANGKIKSEKVGEEIYYSKIVDV